MARQTTPRFDLYGELGVEPSADTDTIEAAYRALIDRQPDPSAKEGVRRTVRRRLALDWLTDPERRRRYDASRARAAARAEKAAELESRELAAAASDGQEQIAEIPWPAKDLERPGPGIEWSSTPPEAMTVQAPRRRSVRKPMGAIVLVALAGVIGAGTYIVATNVPAGNVAERDPTASPPPAPTSPGETATAQPEPTSAPTPDPTPGSTDVPPGAQQAAWDAIRALTIAAESVDVATAQTLLGDTAPGLRASGLRRASFPELAPGEIIVQREGDRYVALAGDDRLTSPEGLSWTFDYADRPLAAYRSPGAEPVHDLWWTETDGNHHLYLQLDVATVSRSGVTAKVRWSFDPSRPDDATYFELAGLVISDVELGGELVSVETTTVLIAGLTTLTLEGTLATEVAVASELLVDITASNPRELGGNPRLIDTTFLLVVR